MNFLTERIDALAYDPQHPLQLDWPLWYELGRINYGLFLLVDIFTEEVGPDSGMRWLFLSLIAEMSDQELDECFGLKAPNPPLFKNPHDHD